jgi:signal transduction histidine kinase
MKDRDQKAVAALRESESKFKKLSQEFNVLLNAIPDNLVLLTPEMKIIWANRASASKFGKNESELYGKHCYKLCCNLSAPCKCCPAVISFESGKEETAQRMNTEGKIWDIRAFPIKDDSGKVKNVIEVARDITARVRMEKEAKTIQSQLIHTNKMTALGTLVSGVAHEINNPNSFILSNAQLFAEIWRDTYKVLRDRCEENEEFYLGGLKYSEIESVVPKLIHGINDGATRISNIVNYLKDFARPDRSNLNGKVDINKVILNSRTILDNKINKITDGFHITYGNNLPIVKGSSQQVEQVVMNLVINSLQALPDKKSGIWISTSYEQKTGFAIIKIRDEGSGMSGEILDRITEPFFTTKLNSGGTGLGLSISYSIVKEHNGLLEFESKQGKGTTAYLKLPVHDSKTKCC